MILPVRLKTPIRCRYIVPPMNGGADEDLVRRIASGDRMAMRVLYGRHQLKVHRFICGIMRDLTAAGIDRGWP